MCVERLSGDTKNVPLIIADNHQWSESKKGGKFTNSETGEVTNMPHPTEPTVRKAVGKNMHMHTPYCQRFQSTRLTRTTFSLATLHINQLSTVLDLIEGADDDAEIAANSFNILSRLCDHTEGLLAVGKTKALEIAIEWLQNNMEDAPPEATAACLRLMEKLCPLDDTVSKLQVCNTAHQIHCCVLL